MESNEYLNFAKEMCSEAGKIMKKYFYQDSGISYKGDRTIVTLADKEINHILIEDDANAKYSYDVVLLNDKNSNCQELVNIMSKINNEMNIFDSIKLANEYTNLWNNIITNTEWKEVTNATIAQPVDAENGTQYVVLLKKELNGATTYDAQVLTSKKETSEDQVQEVVKTETRSELPVTFDNPILFVLLGVAVVAIVIIAIRIRSLSKKNEK